MWAVEEAIDTKTRALQVSIRCSSGSKWNYKELQVHCSHKNTNQVVKHAYHSQQCVRIIISQPYYKRVF